MGRACALVSGRNREINAEIVILIHINVSECAVINGEKTARPDPVRFRHSRRDVISGIARYRELLFIGVVILSSSHVEGGASECSGQ